MFSFIKAPEFKYLTGEKSELNQFIQKVWKEEQSASKLWLSVTNAF